jgi:glycosyltransferase involved in cell wall biosynthesis
MTGSTAWREMGDKLSAPAPVRVVAICYSSSPSTRLRVQQYAASFERDGVVLRTLLLPQSDLDGLRSDVRLIHAAVARADVVLVQRVLHLWLNVLLAAARKPVVFDLDDSVQYIRTTQLAATDHPATAKDRARVVYRRVVRGSRYYSSRRRLLRQVLRLSKVVIVGNSPLRDELAGLTRSRTIVLPTCVPADPSALKAHAPSRPITLGWVGTSDNLIHLRTLEPAFRRLADRFGDGVRLHVVTSRPYESASLPTVFTKWSVAAEAQLTRTFDIGLMPLIDDRFSRGKSAFKAILCMSYGIPVVVSPVGVNAEVVRDGSNGLLASSADEWEAAIARLADSWQLRAELGRNAFRTVEERFSTARAYPVLKSVLERVARGEAVGEPALADFARAVS